MGPGDKLAALVRKTLRLAFASAGVSIALGVFFIGFLALTLSLTSDARIIANLRQASIAETLPQHSYPTSIFGHSGHQFDAYTDCVALGINLGNEGENVFRRVAESSTATRETGNGPCRELNDGVRSGQVSTDYGYLRFWHGYQAYFRILLSVVPFDAMMRITALLFFSALIFFALQVQGIFGRWAWIAAILPFFALSDLLTVPMVATHALSLAWAFFTASLTPLIIQRVRDPEDLALPLFALVAGASYNFLNFLINPPLAPALIAFFYMAQRHGNEPRDAWRAALYALMLIGFWYAGFFIAWIEKWAFAASLLGPDAVRAELAQIFGKYATTQQRLAVNFLGATRRNLIPGWNWYFFGYIAASCAASAAIVLALVRKHGGAAARITAFCAICAPSFIALISWIELARAHSAEHSGFVSRTFLLFGIIPTLAAIKLWREARNG